MSLTAPQAPAAIGEHDPDALYFLPLGGAGEFGMNLSLYGYRGQWLIVDCGVTFGEEEHQPGVDVIMADPAFIVERRDQLLGIVATHAHEDHIGAIPYLWPQLRCPVWATPFTASVLRAKLVEARLNDQIEINTVPMSGRFTIGPFELELITLTHSIPEPNAVVIRTSAGTVLHTGDWKLDPEPLIGETTDEARLRAVGDEGVLAIVCDSTNALKPGISGSEGDLRRSLTELIGHYDGRVAVACFASNVARLETIAHAARAHDRDVALVGRSLWRIEKAARDNGYLADVPRFLTEDEAGYVPRDKILLICTGSQGEPRAALARIAREGQVEQALVIGNGDLIRLDRSGGAIVDEVPVGRIASDGKSLLPIGGAVLQQRRRLAGDGSVVATIVVDRRGWLAAPPQVSLIGLAEANAEPARTLCDALADAMEGLPAPQRHDDAAVRDVARRVLRRG